MHHTEYKEIVEFVQGQLAGFKLVYLRSEITHAMLSKGRFTQVEVQDLERRSGEALRTIRSDFPKNFRFGKPVKNIALTFMVLRSLNEDQKQRISETIDKNQKDYTRGQIIFEKDHSHLTHLAFITKGFVKETWGTMNERKRGEGYILGGQGVGLKEETAWPTTIETYPEYDCTLS